MERRGPFVLRHHGKQQRAWRRRPPQWVDGGHVCGCLHAMASSSTTGRAAAGEAASACCKSICAEVCTDFGNNFDAELFNGLCKFANKVKESFLSSVSDMRHFGHLRGEVDVLDL
ncbi:uncharacterized protein LOC120703249 isoform X2 [Panicum virgatum]|uniref:uncharacterized protein LOC120703249 isoform X2 n=1 Tax=Panicum virgatum TaxID=38727 RepID=UPI0019D5C116|nr:uncharacterized protein LOC120703249 isoform X2 [Panicum virgatum]